jgi:hypothetical protein
MGPLLLRRSIGGVRVLSATHLFHYALAADVDLAAVAAGGRSRAFRRQTPSLA